jgi:ArsR family transcriptional regulator
MDESTSIEPTSPGRARGMDESLTLLSAVADPVRWAVLSHLAEQGTSCVCVLQERVPVAANLLSYHLKVLRDAALVTSSRRGRWIDYSLAEGASRRLAEALPVSEPAERP